MIFGRETVAAVTDRYAYLATTDSLAITRYDDAGGAEVFSLEHFRERANEDWERFVIDTRRANEFISKCGLRLLEDLPARATLPAPFPT